VTVVDNSKINYANLTDEDIDEIIQFSKRPGVFNEIVNSIGGDSIFGNMFAKTCIALSLFGGVRVVSEDHSVRGDIHVLLCGGLYLKITKCKFILNTLWILKKIIQFVI
jgi:DNA replicative helicase MCM subunit Mcm2 (Cdc46/Mcm family)